MFAAVDPLPVDPDLIDFAVAIAREAGQLTLAWFQSESLAVAAKGDGSPVTAADRAAERLIRERIARRFPDDTVIGEEEPDSVGSSTRTWVIDPIDGTKAFTHGVPLYSTLVAMVDESGPAIGVIHLPGLAETVWAGRGHGAFHDGVPCRVSRHSDLEGAYVCTSGFSYWPRSELDAALASGAAIRTWGDAYGYVLVATGRAEAMIDPEAEAWDLAPIAVIVPEAGGTFTDTAGVCRWDTGSGVATNGALHDEVLGLFRDRAP